MVLKSLSLQENSQSYERNLGLFVFFNDQTRKQNHYYFSLYLPCIVFHIYACTVFINSILEVSYRLAIIFSGVVIFVSVMRCLFYYSISSRTPFILSERVISGILEPPALNTEYKTQCKACQYNNIIYAFLHFTSSCNGGT